jgi:phosphopantetheinyl transferase
MSFLHEPVGDGIHLWWADSRTLNLSMDDEWMAWLSPAEQQALWQKIPKVRAQAFASKIFLKALLAYYLQTTAESLCFHFNAFGKPALMDATIHFNLSHSEHYLALALCKTSEIGVDVQTMRSSLDPLAIAARFFHQSEYQWLQALPTKAQQFFFYRLWSAKEAVLKAAGVGIGATGLAQVVFCAPIVDTLSMDWALTADQFQGYQCQEFFNLDNSTFSVATCQKVSGLQTFQWQGKLAL